MSNTNYPLPIWVGDPLNENEARIEQFRSEVDGLKLRGSSGQGEQRLLVVGVVLMVSSILVLFFESQSEDANIVNGGDALWWAFVTITTVGYGDRYPVTPGGRVTAVFVMFSGVGIIGALASILASILLPQPNEMEEPDEPPAPPPGIEQELAAVKQELSALRGLLEKQKGA